MKKIKQLIIFVLIFSSFGLSARTEQFRGVARDSKGETAYIEQHEIKYNDQGFVETVVTRYMRPKGDGEIFARLESYFSEGTKFVPKSIFTDFRFNHQEETIVSADKKTLEIVHTDLDSKKTKSKTVEISPQMVLGQGYHNYILNDFEKFNIGEKRTLDFVVPARLDYYRFDLTYVGLLKTEQRRVFRLDITNWVLKLFADKILVTYDDKSKRLMTYEGLTNIPDDNGKNQSLVISMEYDQEGVK